MNYYEILGVSKNATEEELKKAYRQIAKETHPDYFPDDKEKEERFKKANEAYEILSNPEKRRQYDLILTSRESILSNPEKRKRYDLWDFSYNLEKAYDDFIECLNIVEKYFKEYGLTTEKFRKAIEGKRGILTLKEINSYKISINKQLQALTLNKKEIEKLEFSLNEIKQIIENSNEHIDLSKYEEYLKSVKPYTLVKEEIETLENELFRLNMNLKDKLNREYTSLLNELHKRNLESNIKSFGKKTSIGITIKITYELLDKIKEFITEYDKLIYNLNIAKIKFYYLLSKLNMKIDDLTIDNIKIINSNLEKMIEDNLRQREVIEEIKNKL